MTLSIRSLHFIWCAKERVVRAPGAAAAAGPTGETDQAKATQLAAVERERIIKQVDAEREAGRRPMTVADAFRRYKEGVTLGTPTEATAARELAWLESLLGSNKSVGEKVWPDIDVGRRKPPN